MKLQNISQLFQTSNLLPIFLAVILIDFIVILIAKYTTFFGKQINVWYRKLGMTAVLLDVLIIVIGILITSFLFTYFQWEFTPLKFIGVALIVQLIHDTLLYQWIIKPHTKGTNLILDIYQDYANENGWKILVADASMIIGSCFLAMVFKNYPEATQWILVIVLIYLLPYFVYQKEK